ncbi:MULTISPECIES: hypothetical protein [Halorussus]|uniref:hypothetical protein n=1 Tax=Halorussus TaxID=1070314 RepID=UPI0020A06FD5|nr:hypothetical protein [Halorussus vallis]USZ74469.1 hypothetical protein NGM07_13565 [Halorussus vallis]
MIDRYETPDEAIPHETTVLVLTETETCFGEPFAALFEEVRSQIACDKLLVEDHYRSAGNLPDYDVLIQYGVWLVHYSSLLAEGSPSIRSYLENESVPDETQVLVVFDTDDERLASNAEEGLETEYSDRLTVVSTRNELVYYLLGHFNTATPCSAAGLDYLVSWNNKMSDFVGPYRDVDRD